jgi:hypothetical protein
MTKIYFLQGPSKASLATEFNLSEAYVNLTIQCGDGLPCPAFLHFIGVILVLFNLGLVAGMGRRKLEGIKGRVAAGVRPLFY